ncbi:MAG: beta-galactosidase [Hyphomicrobiales bacterium]|nr:beta-galactosidase [Hyphomicrobiales bacterium]MCP5000856.1 beta-galactosidase [Hyphomicrobiales bacterium]
MASKPQIGVCYYPEHWPETLWKEDARRMAALGITYVRIGEFAWSRLEPARDQLSFDWLERAIDILHEAGLKVVLGTPTATPPKWLVDEMPDMLPVDAEGHVIGFGSRKHYCFSHRGYRAECERIVTALAERFGKNPAVTGWQIDNEYACHNTTRNWSTASLLAFRQWLKQRYGTIDRLNTAWGNVFWSMEYADFQAIDLPALAPTEHNPAHSLDFYRFSSDQVVSFNRLQTDILRRLSPGRDLIHNFMGRTLAFDHFEMGADLDISSWDSYPLGFLEDRSDADDAWRRRFARAGDPDFQAFHHDLYRTTSGGRWWVMEQQPGPVNWADHNPAPSDGMVRLWSLEAFAHGAEVVSYFRWRQAPFAQEQMHAGLLRPDGAEAEAFHEAEAVLRDLDKLDLTGDGMADVAIVLDYTSAWAWEIQPQGCDFDYFRLVFDHYRALRRKGLSVDILPPDTSDFSAYKMIVIPGLFAWSQNLVSALEAFEGVALVGPRSGSKTAEFSIPAQLPPDLPAHLMDLTIARVESLRADSPLGVAGSPGQIKFWREFLIAGDRCQVEMTSDDGKPLLVRQQNWFYLGGWPDDRLLDDIVAKVTEEAGLPGLVLPEGLRVRRKGNELFAFNYGDVAVDLADIGIDGKLVLGQTIVPPADVAVVNI